MASNSSKTCCTIGVWGKIMSTIQHCKAIQHENSLSWPICLLGHCIKLLLMYGTHLVKVNILANFEASLSQPSGFHSGYVHYEVPVCDVPAIIEAARSQLQDCSDAPSYWFRAARSRCVVTRTFEQRFRPFSCKRQYHQLPVLGM